MVETNQPENRTLISITWRFEIIQLLISNRYGEVLDEADVREKSIAMELTVSQKPDT